MVFKWRNTTKFSVSFAAAMSFSFGFCVDDDSAPNSQDEKVSTVPASESAENKQKYLPARKVAFDHLVRCTHLHAACTTA